MRRFLGWAAAILIMFLTCGCLGFVVPMDVAAQLVVGWLLFLARVAPQMRIDWPGLLSASVCVVLLAFGIHQLGSWFVQNGLQSWRWRWTLSILAVVVLMFVSGIAAVGVAHQTVWLASAKEPLVIVNSRGLRAAAQRSQSASNLRQIGVAVYSHFEVNKKLPPGVTFDSFGRPLHGWQTFLLPFLEHEDLYKQLDLRRPWNDLRNEAVAKAQLTFYSMIDEKDDQGYYPISYAANVHLFSGDKRFGLMDMPDGTSNTIMAGEIGTNLKPWMYPLNWRDPIKGINKHPDGFGSATIASGGANILMADGSVYFKAERISAATLKAVSTPAGGEPVPPDWLE